MVNNGTDAAEDLHIVTEPLIYGMDSDYHEAYRDGNFGLKRGRINITRAKRWSQAHLVVAILITVLGISAVGLMEGQHRFGIYQETSDAFDGVPISCGIVAIITSCCSIYLISYLTTLRRPLFVLLLVRLLSVLECMLAISGFVTTLVAVSDSHESDYSTYYTGPSYKPDLRLNWRSEYYGLFIFLCVFLVIAMIADFIIAGAWLFHWWKCCECCQKCKSVCIFEPGEPLAEGVSDPRTGFLRECMYVCWSAFRSDCGTII